MKSQQNLLKSVNRYFVFNIYLYFIVIGSLIIKPQHLIKENNGFNVIICCFLVFIFTFQHKIMYILLFSTESNISLSNRMFISDILKNSLYSNPSYIIIFSLLSSILPLRRN